MSDLINVWKDKSTRIEQALLALKYELCKDRPQKQNCMFLIEESLRTIDDVTESLDKDAIQWAHNTDELKPLAGKVSKERREIDRLVDPARYNSPNQRLDTRDRIENACRHYLSKKGKSTKSKSAELHGLHRDALSSIYAKKFIVAHAKEYGASLLDNGLNKIQRMPKRCNSSHRKSRGVEMTADGLCTARYIAKKLGKSVNHVHRLHELAKEGKNMFPLSVKSERLGHSIMVSYLWRPEDIEAYIDIAQKD